MVVWGVLLLVIGLLFAVTPLGVARVTGHVRYVPYPRSPTTQQMRYFRIAGLVIAAGGAVFLLLS